MIVYKYNETTKEYVGETIAFIDPLESQAAGHPIYVMPASCTDEEPLHPKEGFVVCFNEGKDVWEYIEDNRGLTVYSKKGKVLVLSELGPIPDGYSKEKPMSLRELKDEKVLEIKRVYQEAYFKKVNIGEIEVSIEDSVKIKDTLSHTLRAFEDFENVSVNLGEEVVSLRKEEAESIVKQLYVRSMLLNKNRGELLEELAGIKGKQQVKELEVVFDVEKEVEELSKLSIEQINKKLG